MLSVTKSLVLHGLDGILVNIEIDISSGIPSWEIIGLPDVSVKESKERVKTAIKNSGIMIPNRKYIINLSPASVKKEGSYLELAIAVGILISMGIINSQDFSSTAFIGELTLYGNLNQVNGILPICIEALKNNIKRIIVPKENEKEAAIIKEIEVIGISNLKELILYLNGKLNIESGKFEVDNLEENYFDYRDVRGQAFAKRALEVAASGWHNCLMIGAPGSGKTMMAKRFCSILPDFTFEESLETTKIYSLAGKKINSLISKRPFVSPHNLITLSGLIGGGRIPKPGEISLAHNGVLFLDEFPEFNRKVLESLRIPLEEKKISIDRVSGKYFYPCNFILIASMNPCPCGYFGSKNNNCCCTQTQIKNYRAKLSGPLLDRIDIQIEVPKVEFENFEISKNETSYDIRKRVNVARNMQKERYKNLEINFNSELSDDLVNKFCILDNESKKILEMYFNKLNLSARSYIKILKVSRTIADLDSKEKIESLHVLEAIRIAKNLGNERM